MNRRRSNLAGRGFTLLEIIIAMLMVAFIAASLYATMRIAFDQQSSAETAVEPSRTADMAMDFIREDLQNALAPPTNPTAISLIGNFEGVDNGDADDLNFYSTADMKLHPSANGEVKEIELTIDTPPGATQQCLVRKCSRNPTTELEAASGQTPEILPDEEILVRGVAGFNLRYFDGTNWNDSWDSTGEDNTLPAAVEVTITLDRSTANQQRLIKFMRVFQLPCSTATYDTQVNSGAVQ